MNFGDSWSSKNSQSPLLRLGTSMDPLVALFPNLGDWKIKTGDKLQSWVSDNIAKKDPLIKMDRKYGLADWSSEARKVSDWAQEKPLDSTAMVLGGIFGGGALAGMGGGAAGGAGGASGAGLGSTAAPAAAWGAPAGIEGVTVVGSSGAAMSPGTAAALQAAAASQAMNAQPQQQQGKYNWRDMLDNMPNQQQQQEQRQASIPQRQATGARPVSWMDKVKSGLGQTGDRMFPIDQAYGLNQQQQKAMRKNALLQMGLGMMSAAGQGAGFGEAAAFGLGRAQTDLTGALQRGYENARETRQEQRQDQRDQVSDERFDKTYDRQVAAEERAEERDQRNFERQLKQDQLIQDRFDATRQQDAEQFERRMRVAEAKASGAGLGKPPAGYRWTPEGNLEAIEGGPATVIPAEAAGRIGMTEQAITAASDARKAFFTEDGKLDRSAVMAAATGAPWSEGRAAGQRVKLAVETALRLATGAAAPETEVDRYVAMYTPSVLDSDAAAKTKLDSLDDFIKNTNKYLRQGRGKAPEGGSGGGWSIQEVP